eukprot:2046894-Amphidinium_carterae.1
MALKQQRLQHTLRSQRLQSAGSHHKVKLYETYSDSQTLYLLLELALGGELFYTYFRKAFDVCSTPSNQHCVLS